jgi:broad specificity phosphatase PhoE
MTDGVTRFYFIRHGESTGNATNVWTSSPHGYPLTDRGHQQARDVGERLRDADLDVIFSSNLVRAKETAAEIGAVLELPTTVIDGVQELHVGVHEGSHDDEVAPIAQEVFTAWLGAGDLSGGFAEGETGEQIVSRFLVAVTGVADEHPGRTIAVVAHGGVLALGLGALCPNLPTLTVATHLLANCDVVEVELSVTGEWSCRSWAGRLID